MINSGAAIFRLPDLRGLLRELGVDPAAVLRMASLSPLLWSEGEARLTTRQLFSVWEALGRCSDDPMTGVRLAVSYPLDQYHPACLLANRARDFRDALRRFARYKLLCFGEEMGLEETGAECPVTLRWPLPDQAPPRLLADAAFASTLELGRRGLGRALRAARVELARPPQPPEGFEEFFGCRIVFRAGQDCIVFHRADLDLPFVTYNAELLEMLGPVLDREMDRHRAGSGVCEQVQWVLKRLLSSHRPQIDDVAKELGMSARTLQRRISDEGSNFRLLLNAARHELACEYLAASSLSLTETACLLGFEDPNSFLRAFREWEGATRGGWRRGRETVPPAVVAIRSK